MNTNTVPNHVWYVRLISWLLFGNRLPIWKISLRAEIWKIILSGGTYILSWWAKGLRYNHQSQNLQFTEDGTIIVHDTKDISLVGRTTLVTEVVYGESWKRFVRWFFDFATVKVGVTGDQPEAVQVNTGNPQGIRNFIYRAKDGTVADEEKTDYWYAFRRRVSFVLSVGWLLWLAQLIGALYLDGAKTLPVILGAILIVSAIVDLFRVRVFKAERRIAKKRVHHLAFTLVVAVLGIIIALIELATGFRPGAVLLALKLIGYLIVLTIVFGT